MSKKLKTGSVIGWVVIDPISGEWVARYETRKQARDDARGFGRIARVEVDK